MRREKLELRCHRNKFTRRLYYARKHCRRHPLQSLMFILGYVPEDRWAQSSGALHDIRTVITDTIPDSADAEVKSVAEAILRRFLQSSDQTHNPPGFFRSEWEGGAWNAYLTDEFPSRLDAHRKYN